jgi:hypothetical protein
MNLFDFVAGPVIDLVGKFIPDPAQKAAAQLEVLKLQQSAEYKKVDAMLQLAQGQVDINKAEATTDLFRGGWRPAVGWVCAFALLSQYFLVPCMQWASSIWGVPAPPKLDMADLIGLLFAMMGVGTLRSIDKANGVG